MLDLKNYATEMADISVGETKRVSHTTCEAGEDTRDRLYLTRNQSDPTVVIAYCHNCQQGGRWKDGNYMAYRDNRHNTYVAVGKNNSRNSHNTVAEVEVPHHMVPDFKLWTSPAKAWAFERGLSSALVERYGIQYDPSSDRVYLPRADFRPEPQNLRGYQLRSLGKGSKYTTVQQQDGAGWSTVYLGVADPSYAVIVEDLCSAIAIAEACAAEDSNPPFVFVNHGTKVDPTMMYAIAESFKWCTVWLDNDSAHVRSQAATMHRTIQLYCNTCMVKVCRAEKDPKYYTWEQIARELDEVWK